MSFLEDLKAAREAAQRPWNGDPDADDNAGTWSELAYLMTENCEKIERLIELVDGICYGPLVEQMGYALCITQLGKHLAVLNEDGTIPR